MNSRNTQKRHPSRKRQIQQDRLSTQPIASLSLSLSLCLPRHDNEDDEEEEITSSTTNLHDLTAVPVMSVNWSTKTPPGRKTAGMETVKFIVYNYRGSDSRRQTAKWHTSGQRSIRSEGRCLTVGYQSVYDARFGRWRDVTGLVKVIFPHGPVVSIRLRVRHLKI